MKSLLRRCDVCDGARGEVLHAPRFVLPDEDPLPRGYDVVACERCGFVFADTPAAQDVYDAYYALRSKYESATVGTGGGSSTEDRARLADVASLLAASAPWRDRRVCHTYLMGMCIHDMFTNTKNDLGHCDKVHDDRLKKGYEEEARARARACACA